VPDVVPMQPDDAGPCGDVFWRAISALRVSMGFEPMTGAPDGKARHIEHLQRNDPGGSWVARHDGRVVGFTQAAIRDDTWVLAHLFVAPEHQSAGVGAALLQRAHAYGPDTTIGIIGSSPDPRAIRRYAQLP